MQNPGRLIGLREAPLHVLAQLVGAVIVRTLEYGFAKLRQEPRRILVVSILRPTGPQRVLVQRQRLPRRIRLDRSLGTVDTRAFDRRRLGCAAAKDHSAQAPVPDRQGVHPLAGRLLVPQFEIGRALRLQLRPRDLFPSGKRSRQGRCGLKKPPAAHCAHTTLLQSGQPNDRCWPLECPVGPFPVK